MTGRPPPLCHRSACDTSPINVLFYTLSFTLSRAPEKAPPPIARLDSRSFAIWMSQYPIFRSSGSDGLNYYIGYFIYFCGPHLSPYWPTLCCSSEAARHDMSM